MAKSLKKSSPRRLTRRSERQQSSLIRAVVKRPSQAAQLPASRSSTSARIRFVSSSTNRCRAASSRSSTKRTCAASAARCSPPDCCADDAVAKGAGRAAAVSRPVPGDEGRQHLRGGDGGMPRRQQRSGIHRPGRTHLRRRDRNPLRPARGQAVGARRHLRRAQARRHCRRSRRRFARTDRGRGNRVRSGITLPLGRLALQDASQNRRSAPSRSSRRQLAGVPQLRPARAAHSMRSAAPGARWRACTSSRAAIRCA